MDYTEIGVYTVITIGVIVVYVPVFVVVKWLVGRYHKRMTRIGHLRSVLKDHEHISGRDLQAILSQRECAIWGASFYHLMAKLEDRGEVVSWWEQSDVDPNLRKKMFAATDDCE